MLCPINNSKTLEVLINSSILRIYIFFSKTHVLFEFSVPGALMPNRPRLRPYVQKLEVSRRTQSVLEFEAAAADHGSVFTCRAFARETMQYPMESSTKVTFNISCKLSCFIEMILLLGHSQKGLAF